ncbi:MAG: (4Fe-4S)-binding protein [Eubacteriales bacterium]|nr:(4Fe-4S)-binding protein [Clostridiales bacterium]MDY5836514.1 (4Fe-4S)-binding protein [Eubacteriales bacterium]
MEGLIKTYESDEIIVFWEPDKCQHSGNCVKGSKTFDTERRPWINLKEDSFENIINTIDKCPSGALRYIRKQLRERGNEVKK